MFSTLKRSTLRSESATGTRTADSVAMGAALEVIDAFTRLISGVYFYARSTLMAKLFVKHGSILWTFS